MIVTQLALAIPTALVVGMALRERRRAHRRKPRARSFREWLDRLE